MDTLNATFKSLVSANMAAAVSMSIFFGAYLLVYPACLYVLLGQRARGQPIHWVLLACVTIQFIVLTTEVVVQLNMLFQSFIGLADQPSFLVQIGLYWVTANTTIHKIAHVCSLINVAVGDAIIVWRVWILFHERAFLVCLPPILTLIGSTTCGIVMVHSIWKGAITVDFIRHIATAAWSLGMFTQGYSTSVIAWQIWHLGVANAKAGNSRSIASYYRAIIIMVIESGAIYTALVLPLTVSYAVGSNASIVLVGALDPMAAIVPASIVIRVGMKRNRQFQTTLISQVDPHANGEKRAGAGAGVGITFAKSQHSVDEEDSV